jgi:hypothetical protein
MEGTDRDTLPETPAGILALAREQRAAADAAEAMLLRLAVEWAITHPAESIDEAETITLRSFGDTAITVAGPGAPLVAEFSVAELAAAVGLSTETGKRYVGQAVELRYRLKRVWARVLSGDLPAWKARRIAEQTIQLSAEAAAHVDRHLAPVAHKVRPVQVDRLVEEAIGRFMPAEAQARRHAALDQRRFDIDLEGACFDGTSQVHGVLDYPDALDLEDAVRAGAAHQLACGSTESLDVRRAQAVADLARAQLTLDLITDPQRPTTAPTVKPVRPVRKVVLHLHLSEAAVTRAGTERGGEVGRVENTRLPVTAQTIRDWCARPDLRVVVKPVVDLAEHVHVEAYEVPDRVDEAVALRDVICVFPWCTRPARTLRPDQHPCDNDHSVPFAEGGPTCTCQIAPLCRRHHRLKTHGGWSYYVLEPGSYVWRSPHGYQYLRDHTGTQDITPNSQTRHPRPPPTPPGHPGET